MSTLNPNYPSKDFVSDEELKQRFVEEATLKAAKKQLKESNAYAAEMIPLPSKGKLYPTDSPLSSGEIEFKYMTAKEEDILNSINYIRNGTAVDKVIESLIIDPEIKYSDIFPFDKEQLFVAARILGYGKDYEVTVTCPLRSCSKESEIVVDLTNLPVTEVDFDKYDMIAPNRFKIVLPITKKEVVFKLLNNGDVAKLTKELETINKASNGGNSQDVTLPHKHRIISIDGDHDSKTISDFVDRLPARDSYVLRERLKEITPKVEFSFDFKCPHCGSKHEGVEFSPDSRFLWPYLTN